MLRFSDVSLIGVGFGFRSPAGRNTYVKTNLRGPVSIAQQNMKTTNRKGNTSGEVKNTRYPTKTDCLKEQKQNPTAISVENARLFFLTHRQDAPTSPAHLLSSLRKRRCSEEGRQQTDKETNKNNRSKRREEV